MIVKIKEIVRNIIREARGLMLLLPTEIKFESIRKVNKHYEISGIYEYRGLLTNMIIESGRFKIVLDENLEIISLEITPTKERSK